LATVASSKHKALNAVSRYAWKVETRSGSGLGAGGKKRKKAGTGGYFPENKAARLVAKTLAIEY